MSAETLALLALEKGVEVGAVGFKEARELFKETWQRAFPGYDVEKVFFRCVYTIAGAFAFKLFYDFMSFLQAPMETGKAKAAGHMKGVTIPFVSALVGVSTFWLPQEAKDLIITEFKEKPIEELEKIEEVELEKAAQKMGVPVFIHKAVNKYWLHAASLVCLWWIFSEYRSYKKLKALTTKIL